MIHQHHDKSPIFGTGTFVAANAVVIGEVQTGEHCSIWYNVVLRGDVNFIRVGDRTNIQDGSICHVTVDQWPLILGNDVTIGHGVILHGCTIGDGVLVGMGAKILDGAVIGQGAIVGAGALVPEGMQVPENTLVMGVPAKVKRDLADNERETGRELAQRYVKYKEEYFTMGLQHPGVE
ncbi:MAG: gamma carbonic anhydrase family protein [Calditrichaeota bacterium]|nr:MAG: gamma carbonic anhydrase family protein [Calditrichota bacterium]